MKMQTFLRKAAVLATLASFVLGQLSQAVHAASTDIADVPMAVKNQVAPNIVMNLDDSGSMHFEFLPEEGVNFLFSTFLQPRGTSQYGGADYSNQVPNFNDDNLHNFFGRAYQNNAIYYNPSVTYQPWSNSDGSLMAIAVMSFMWPSLKHRALSPGRRKKYIGREGACPWTPKTCPRRSPIWLSVKTSTSCRWPN